MKLNDFQVVKNFIRWNSAVYSQSNQMNSNNIKLLLRQYPSNDLYSFQSFSQSFKCEKRLDAKSDEILHVKITRMILTEMNIAFLFS